MLDIVEAVSTGHAIAVLLALILWELRYSHRPLLVAANRRLHRIERAMGVDVPEVEVLDLQVDNGVRVIKRAQTEPPQ